MAQKRRVHLHRQLGLTQTYQYHAFVVLLLSVNIDPKWASNA